MATLSDTMPPTQRDFSFSELLSCQTSLDGHDATFDTGTPIQTSSVSSSAADALPRESMLASNEAPSSSPTPSSYVPNAQSLYPLQPVTMPYPPFTSILDHTEASNDHGLSQPYVHPLVQAQGARTARSPSTGVIQSFGQLCTVSPYSSAYSSQPVTPVSPHMSLLLEGSDQHSNRKQPESVFRHITPENEQWPNTHDKPASTVQPYHEQTRLRGRRVSNVHMHDGRMFTCHADGCGKVFKRSEHLKRHIRSIHTLEKPFQCPHQSCHKRFSRSDNLNQHIRIHRHSNNSVGRNGKPPAGHRRPENTDLSNASVTLPLRHCYFTDYSP